MRIALYGGSFNPIHLGHLIIARAVAEEMDLDRVIFLPSASPPHKDAGDLAPAEHRAAMVRLAIDNEPIFAFSDYDLKRSGPTYTIETVKHFLKHGDTEAPSDGPGRHDVTKPPGHDWKQHWGVGVRREGVPICGDVDFFLGWIMGADSLMELPTWHRPGELVDACQIITAARPGYEVIDWNVLAKTFSVAQIERLRQGVVDTPRIDISSSDVRRRIREGRSIRFLVPEPVREYIDSERLYP